MILEFIMFLYEVYRKHNLSKQSVDIIVQYDEDKRRHLYSQRYFTVAISTLSFLIVLTMIVSLTLPPKECLPEQSLRFNTVCTDC